MGWIGAIAGCFAGGYIFGGTGIGSVVGSLIGSIAGSYFEDRVSGKKGKPRSSGDGSYDGRAEAVYLAAVSAMMAKIAKADGRVTREEIEVVQMTFRRMGLKGRRLEFCMDVFRKAKNDNHSIYEYAADFADAVGSCETRELFYTILWDLSCADGVLAPQEEEMLRNLPPYLRISRAMFAFEYRRRIRGGNAGGGFDAGYSSRSPLDEAYEVLGVSSTASNDEVKRAYREKAKRLHPDSLQAQGVPPEMIKKASEQMAKVNDAWAEIRKSRGI